MSTERFLVYLQQLITMADRRDRSSIALAKAALNLTVELAFLSQKADSVTLRIMRRAEYKFEYIMDHQKDFEGKPGDFSGNKQKRQQLLLILRPGC